MRPADSARVPLSKAIADDIRRDIENGRLLAGDRLPTERSLMETLKVGRSTVREAMKILVTLGLVEIRHGDGAYVTQPMRIHRIESPAFTLAVEQNVLRDLVELRQAIEPMIAVLAAERATPEDTADLEALLRVHEQKMDQGEAWHWAPLEFELALAEISGNPLLVQMEENIRDLWVGLSGEFRQAVNRTQDWMHEHWVILDAVKGMNQRRIRGAVLLHLDLERFERDMSR